MAPEPSAEFLGMIATRSPAVQELALAARRLILDVAPRSVEVVWVRQGTAGYGVGPKKMSEQFAYLAVHAKRVNLGFYYGAELDDPAGLLQGPGKLMRMTPIEALPDLDRPELRELLGRASTYLPRLRPR